MEHLNANMINFKYQNLRDFYDITNRCIYNWYIKYTFELQKIHNYPINNVKMYINNPIQR